MAPWQPSEPPKRPSPGSSCLTAVVTLAIAVAGMIGIWWVFTRMLPPRAVTSPESRNGVGSRLTFVELEPLTGDPPRFTSADLQGRVVMLNFWGPWCPPCRSELPHMADLQERLAGQDAFRLVAVAYPSDRAASDVQALRKEAAALLKRLNLDLPTYVDPDDMTRAAVDQLIGFEGFPTTLLLDRGGVIRAIWVGYSPGVEREMERYVDQLLLEPSGKDR